MAQAEPVIKNISLRGLQIGQPTTVVIDGSDLLPDPQIVLPIPVVSQSIQQGATASRIVVEINVHPDAPVGIHPLRVASQKGISNAVAVGVDRLPQLPFAEQIEALPAALHGNLQGSQILKTQFVGSKGLHVVVDVESRRLDGKLRPVVRLHDERGRQLAWSPARPQIAGDARLEAVLPADGRYTIQLHDVVYRGAAPGFFRMKVGDLGYADLVFPPGVQRGSTAELALASSNLTLEQPLVFTAAADDFRASQPAQLPAAAQLTGGRPRVIVSDHLEVVEAPREGDQRQELPAAPLAINGRLAAAGEEDQFLLAVKPGSKLRLEVLADRLGSPLDGVLVLRGEQGNELARSDDQRGTSDPGLDFSVPGNLEKVVVALSDLLGRGGDDFIYRVQIREQGQPDFSLTLDTDRLTIPAGGTQVLRLSVQRRGYNGAIQLALPGLPEQVQVQGGEIPAGAQIGLLTLTAAEDTPVQGLARIVGRGGDEAAPLTRLARLPESDAARHQPWLADDLGWAVSQPAPIGLAWAEPAAGAPLLLGEKFPLRLTLTRREAATGNIRVRLLTTQVMPKKKVKENNQEKVVDDVDRALRLPGDAQFAADVAEGTVEVLVPADLPRQRWGLVLQAELLGGDNKTVVATTVTPVRYLTPQPPFTVELAASDPIEATAGGGPTGKLTGKIHRQQGYDKPVTITLAELPKGYAAPQVEVPAGQDAFELPVRFEYGAKPGELKNVKLLGRATSDLSKTNTSVQSDAVTVGLIKVVPGEKPPQEKPYEVFEDDEKFVAYLSQGDGQISLETGDKYSGTASIKVTPNQRFHEAVPNLQVKIREKPGPGEYRFLRFAWKKQGGASICLQLNHDGNWGPSDDAKPGATFRYHAGSGGECYGASLAVDEKLPGEFVVVTRDLFADFGEFTFTGIAFSPVDGDFALFDHLYLARTAGDFDLLKTE